MTQEELAGNAGLSIPTVRLLERTHGNLTSWNVVLGALALEVAGRNLPAGETLGRSIAALRRSRGFTQRGLAELVGVTQPTILASNGTAAAVSKFWTASLSVWGQGPISSGGGRRNRSSRTPGMPRRITGGKPRPKSWRRSTRCSANSTSTRALRGSRGLA